MKEEKEKEYFGALGSRDYSNELLKVFRGVMENSPDGLAITDNKGNIRYANSAIVDILGNSKEEILGENITEFRDGDLDFQSVKQEIRENGKYQVENQVQKKDGEVVDVEIFGYKIENGDESEGENTDGKGYMASISDISKRKNLERKLIQKALKDPLTDLYNRNYFEEIIEEEMNRCNRNGSPISFMIVDVDNFKEINDKYGHKKGDIVLKNIADILEDSTRKEDKVIRYGGDEFLVVLLETGEKYSKVGERIKSNVNEYNRDQKSEGPSLSLSIGTDYWEPSPVKGYSIEEAEEAIEEADNEMYRKKNEKKDSIKSFRKEVVEKLSKSNS